jgi:hypothetical protein
VYKRQGLECSNEAAHFKIADLTTTGNAGLAAVLNGLPATLVHVAPAPVVANPAPPVDPSA